MNLKSIQFAIDSLDQGLHTVLLYVAESNGSSPGRKGFMMSVNESATFKGTIGGGIMEVKLVELAIDMCKKRVMKPLLKHQFHDKEHSKNQSGMICSGDQHIIFIPLKWKHAIGLENLLKHDTDAYLKCDERGVEFINGVFNPSFKHSESGSFELMIKYKALQTVHIFGAGHVGLALGAQMELLEYPVLIYDNRSQFPHVNLEAEKKKIRQIDYEDLHKYCDFAEEDIVIVVSFSYRDDKIILKQLFQQAFSYIGMMGSDAKVLNLKSEFQKEGISELELEHVHTPIGLPIYSKTAKEIAVSIAAQIILKANKNLPTGRKY